MRNSPPAICIAAFGRRYGKTSIIQGVIEILNSIGMKVFAIKHSTHPLREDAGKDTDRFRKSGALASAVLTKDGEAILYIPKSSLNDLISLASSLRVDLILCEGFKSSNYPKLIIARSTDEFRTIETLEGVIGIIFDGSFKGKEPKVPILKKDPAAVASFILSFLKDGALP